MTNENSLQAALARGERDFLPPPRFYYTETLQGLIGEHAAEIDRRLVAQPREFRERLLAPQFAGRGRLAGEEAWLPLRTYLDSIEAEMSELLGDHSPAYWLHLYRRIAPRLAKGHDDKTDGNTVALVRRIAELAFFKHGDLARNDDLGRVDRTRLETFLDGHFYRLVAAKLDSKLKARKRYEQLRRSPQSVMLRFSEDELLRAFQIEGLAYEYWKASAGMRSIGKGSSVEWDQAESWFSYDDNDVHPLLFGIYDERIAAGGGLHTLLGTWTQLAEVVTDEARFYFASYNPHPEPEIYSAWNPVEHRVGKGVAALNFHIGRGSLDRFATAHAFMSDAFKKRHGVSLEAVFFCIWAASFLAVFPERLFFRKATASKEMMVLSNLTNLHFRGYALTGLTMDRIADEALWWAKASGLKSELAAEEVRRGFDFMLLTPASRNLIGLWSGGKRPLLIPQGDHALVIDLAGVVPFLVSLFFGVREQTGAKGALFEDGVRDALSKEGVAVEFSGEMHWANGLEREVDAAVRIGDRLVLVECFSFERPVDYELAKPGVFEARKKRLSEKIEQAKSLCAAVRADPIGRNFDFSWATEVDWRLASPFVEFAWELSDDFFDDAGVARILDVDELLTLLKDGIAPAADLLKHMPRARKEVAEGA